MCGEGVNMVEAGGWVSAYLFLIFNFLILIFVLFRAALVTYGGSQARGQIGATAAGLHYSHSNPGSEPCLRPTPTAHSNTGGEPASSWILIGFVSSEPRWELHVGIDCTVIHYTILSTFLGNFSQF